MTDEQLKAMTKDALMSLRARIDRAIRDHDPHDMTPYIQMHRQGHESLTIIKEIRYNMKLDLQSAKALYDQKVRFASAQVDE